MHHLIAAQAATESALAKGSWTEGLIIFLLIVFAVAVAIGNFARAIRSRRSAPADVQRLQDVKDRTFRQPSDLV